MDSGPGPSGCPGMTTGWLYVSGTAVKVPAARVGAHWFGFKPTASAVGLCGQTVSKRPPRTCILDILRRPDRRLQGLPMYSATIGNCRYAFADLATLLAKA